MKIRVSHLVAVELAMLWAAGAHASEVPVAVSPGHLSKVVLIESRCPTFSWGQLDGARDYELVVYRLGQGEEAEPVLRERLEGSAYSWTPSLDRCLERGGRYAWSLRGWRGRKPSEWSPAMLFQVAAGPAAAESRAVRAFLQEYLARQRGSIGQSAAGSLAELGEAPSGGVEIADDSIKIDGAEVLTAAATLGETCTNGATRTARVCILTAVSGFGNDDGACELFPVANGWRLDILGGAGCCMDCWE